MMCKNAWLMKKRSSWEKVISRKMPIESLEEIDIPVAIHENIENQNTFFLRQKALSLAIDEMCPKCRKLVESQFDKDANLKELQRELGFPTYQSLVQAKYNCKKRLIKKVMEKMNLLKKGTKQVVFHGK